MTLVFIRTVIIYFFIILAVRLMGKRTVGELKPHELVITILISAVAVIPLEENAMPLANCIIPVMIFVSLEILVSCLSLKSVRFRRLIQGRPVIIIENGKLDQKKLAELRFTMDDIIDALRQKDIFDISQVEQAVIESNGSISVLPKAEYQSVTPSDIKLSVKENGMPMIIATDGKIVDEYFNEHKINKSVITDILKNEGLKEEEAMLLTVDGNGNTYYIKKEKKKKKK